MEQRYQLCFLDCLMPDLDEIKRYIEFMKEIDYRVNIPKGTTITVNVINKKEEENDHETR